MRHCGLFAAAAQVATYVLNPPEAEASVRGHPMTHASVSHMAPPFVKACHLRSHAKNCILSRTFTYVLPSLPVWHSSTLREALAIKALRSSHPQRLFLTRHREFEGTTSLCGPQGQFHIFTWRFPCGTHSHSIEWGESHDRCDNHCTPADCGVETANR